VKLQPTDEFVACGDGGERRVAAEAIDEVLMEARQKFGTLTENRGVITLMSGLSATGTTKLNLYAMNKAALGSLDAASPCRIAVTVRLADASGDELDSSEHLSTALPCGLGEARRGKSRETNRLEGYPHTKRSTEI